MRAFLLALLLVNVAFFAWANYWSGTASAESHLVNQQINPDAIRLLSPAQLAAARSEGEKVVACMEWGGFNIADAAKAQAALAPLGLGNRLAQHRTDETAGWWVFMPPSENRQAAQLKAAELKRLGVEDYFIIQDDPKLLFALSLGIFRTAEAAQNRLAQLRARGVQAAQVGPRATAVQRVHYEVRAVDGATGAKLAELRLAFPGTEVKECAKSAAAAAK